MTSNRAVYHVVPTANRDKWLVTEEGDAGALEFQTKEEAIEAAKKLAQAHAPSQLQVHNIDGAIEYEATYEEDPLVRQLADYGF